MTKYTPLPSNGSINNPYRKPYKSSEAEDGTQLMNRMPFGQKKVKTKSRNQNGVVAWLPV